VIDRKTLGTEHEDGKRELSVSILRADFEGVDLRTWQSWRERCGIPKGSRKASRLSALKLLILASCEGKKNSAEIEAEVVARLRQSPEGVERWFKSFTEPVGGSVSAVGQRGQSLQAVIDAIATLAPDVRITHRTRLYEWFESAGMKFSTKSSYTPKQLAKVVVEARRSQRRSNARLRKDASTKAGDFFGEDIFSPEFFRKTREKALSAKASENGNPLLPASQYESNSKSLWPSGYQEPEGLGYNGLKPGSLYYVRFDLPDGPVWKIGITNKSASWRFISEPTPFTIVWEHSFKDGRRPQQLERLILQKYRQHKYQGKELKSGNTECFVIDVFNGGGVQSVLSMFCNQ